MRIFWGKSNIVQIDKIDFIEHISFDAFNKGTRLVSSVLFAQELFHTKVKAKNNYPETTNSL